MPRSTRQSMAFTAARMYYDEGLTMEAVAKALAVSRSTVSRLLRDARADGLVRISLHPPAARRAEELRRLIEQSYGVRVRIVAASPDDDERTRLRAVASEAAVLLEVILQPDTIVGLAWGTTVAAVVEQLAPHPTPGLQVVQLNGAINTEGAGLTYVGAVLGRAASMWDATAHQFPVPAFFDYAATRDAMWRERSVRRVLDLQQRCRLAVFGVGTFDADVPSHVHTSPYLSDDDLRSLHEDGAVGDVCTVFLRADGSWRGIGLNARGSGADPDQLAKIARRLLVVAGQRKAVALRAALLAGTATDLVLDEITAASLLALG